MQGSTVLLCFVAGAAALRTSLPQQGRPQLSTATSTPLASAALPLAASVAFAVAEPACASDLSWVGPTKAILGPFLALGTVAMLVRTVLSWFPKYDLNAMPWNLAAWPTEPILKPTRQVFPPVAGVDISPLIWIAILTFLNEILLGPQGIFVILEKKGSL